MIFYTDGACSGNGKKDSRGGYGVVGVENNIPLLAHSKFSEGTTNNREELKAILWVMILYGKKINNDWDNDIPIVYSDSAYCVNTLNEWMFGWAKKGWIKSDKKTPENLDLIQTYYDFWQKGHRIDLRKIKGHNGNTWNEIADKLATGNINPEEVLRGKN